MVLQIWTNSQADVMVKEGIERGVVHLESNILSLGKTLTYVIFIMKMFNFIGDYHC